MGAGNRVLFSEWNFSHSNCGLFFDDNARFAERDWGGLWNCRCNSSPIIIPATEVVNVGCQTDDTFFRPVQRKPIDYQTIDKNFNDRVKHNQTGFDEREKEDRKRMCLSKIRNEEGGRKGRSDTSF